MSKACRIGDGHACGDTDTGGSPNTRINNKNVHRYTDSHAHGASQVGHSPNVRINGLGIARIGDNHSGDALAHLPNPQITGSPNCYVNGK